ncbi:NDR1/HIN1-like protein [Algoriphagus antarcticus]|uniref:LEA14-like dessication related protein n=1 Tax=Algoriphagus antarcticus TaxID=238540 RepID=A0A3E0D4Z8_9BACT|nr:LEA type 2 family protein [Algoriphagus antarcticus]REG77607.1 LEA14-like dessication related protein [Algoriphagus antarcticus]
MKAKWIVLVLLALILLPIAVFFALQFYHYSKNESPYRTLLIPRLEIVVIEINDLSSDEISLHEKLLIHNPLPFNFTADSLQYKLFIGDVEVIKSTYTKSLIIRKWNSTWIDLPVTINNDKLLATLNKADKQGKDSVMYRIQTTFHTHTPFKKKFDIDAEKLLPLFYIPTAQLKEVYHDSLSLKGVTLFLKVMIGNRNKFPFQIKVLKYKFSLADNEWINGAEWGEIDIKQQDSTELLLPLRISFSDIFKSIGPLIRKGGKVEYKFNMDLKLVSESNAIKNSKVIVNDTGTLKELIELAKDEKKKEKERQ